MGLADREIHTEDAWAVDGSPILLHDMGRFDGVRLHLLDEGSRDPAFRLATVIDQTTIVHPYADTLLVACQSSAYVAESAIQRVGGSPFRRVFLVDEGEDEGTAPRPLGPGVCALQVSPRSVSEAIAILAQLPVGRPTWHAAASLAAFWAYTPHLGRAALIALRGVATASDSQAA